MAPSRSPERLLTHDDGETLLAIADAALTSAFGGDETATPEPARLTPPLCEPTGVFVTLLVDGQLNGCIGTLGGAESLAAAVGRLAVAAAFHDPRLPRLRVHQLDALTIQISVLSPMTPIPARSHPALAAAIRPGHDGVLVRAGAREGLFLPSVWESLPDAGEFLDHLWRKAGLRPRSWPDGLRPFRFHTDCVQRGPRPDDAAAQSPGTR